MTDQKTTNGSPKSIHAQASSSKPDQELAPPSAISPTEGNQSATEPGHEKTETPVAVTGDAASKRQGNKNALSHGLYSKDIILPWESQDDFEKLHNDFRDEWKPNGCSEEQAVLKLTNYAWLERRMAKSSQLKFFQSTASQELKSGDVSWDKIVRHETTLPMQALGAVLEVKNLIENLDGVLETIRSRPYWTNDSEGKEVQAQLSLLQHDVSSLIEQTKKNVVAGVDTLVGVI